MAVLNNNALVGAAGKGGSGGITTPQRSLRFSSADSSYLSKTFSSGGNRKKWTWSGWVKRTSSANSTQSFFSAYIGSGNVNNEFFSLTFSNDAISVNGYSTPILVTSSVYRDFSAWYHVVLAVDTTNGTSSERVKLWVNGVLVTDFQSTSYPILNADLAVNLSSLHTIGKWSGFTGGEFDGYLANIHFIDGQALTPSDFAYPDPVTGRWEPKAYAGSYSGNSFYLDFSDNSAATAATLGADRSGLGNNWVPNNFAVSAATYSSATVTSSSGATGNSLSNMFDGNLGTYWQIQTVGNHNLTATFATPIPGGALVELYGIRNNPGGGNVVSVNGADITGLMTSSDFAWHDISSVASGGINSITMYRIDGVKNPAIAALRVNGVVVVNSSPSGIDSLRDHPVSAGIDTGLGGEVSGNYCTWNPLDNGGLTLSNGNLEADRSSSGYLSSRSTMGVSSGKWYWECTCDTSNSGNIVGFGIATQKAGITTYLGADAFGWMYYGDATGSKYNNGSSSSYGSSFTTNDVIGIALDLDAGTLVFYKNGVSQGTAYSGLAANTYFPALTLWGTAGGTLNTGQRPFAYTAPSGFKALCDTNLPDPLIKLPSTVMDVKRYDGNGSTQTVSGLGFSPDLVWCKVRTAAYNHTLFDSVRGATKSLSSSMPQQEYTEPTGPTAFTADGWSMSGDVTYLGSVNAASQAYVAWCWDAGSSTVTLNPGDPGAGSISSQVRANTSAGFSIVTWSSTTGVPHTFGHGLGVAPKFVIVKRRSSTGSWAIGHTSLGWTTKLAFDTSAKAADDSAYWSNTAPTSTVISIGDASNIGGDNIAYCWAPVTGYSSFGSYNTTGSTDGPYIHLGFRPRLVLLKAATSHPYGSWRMYDSARGSYNVIGPELYPNLPSSEYGGGVYMDFTANGFKIRDNTAINDPSQTFVYCAWAENPFKYARAR